MSQQIGEDAGKIWNYLNKNRGPQSIHAARKAIQINGERFHKAVGWLAREDKVAIAGEDKNQTISLSGK